MSQPTISSLVRAAARTEPDFRETAQRVLDEEPLERVANFFDRMNVPRSVVSDHNLEPLEGFTVTADRIGSYEEELAISRGIQKYMDRHQRKIKWHAGHPSVEGGSNVAMVMRTGLMVTEMRLERLILLLKSKDELTPQEWAAAREMMRHSYLSIRNHLDLMAGQWVDSVLMALPREELVKQFGNFYEILDAWLRKLDEARERIEERRLELTIVPEGFPPVRPPNYFGGDVLGRGPWKQYWLNIETRAHHFREALA